VPPTNLAKGGKIRYIPWLKSHLRLSRWRERAGVRVGMGCMVFPLTLILSPRGEEILAVIFYVTL